MKSLVIVLMLLMAGSVMAQDPSESIHAIQTGLVAEGTLVTPCDNIVTAVTYNGIFVAQAPYAGYDGIWVYTGAHTYVAGDVVCICGEYKEYYDLSEIDVVAAGIYGSVLKVGTAPVPEPNYVSAADLLDPVVSEMWESCVITIVDGMIVTDTSLGYGEWMAPALDGSSVRFDDFWYDFSTVNVDDCYNNATGVYYYGYGFFKLEPFVDGIQLTDCAVDKEDLSFGAVKALFR